MRDGKLVLLAFTPTFNRWPFAQSCINSMELQRNDGSFELVHSLRFIETPQSLVELTASENLERIRSGQLILSSQEKNGHQYMNALNTIQKGLDAHPDTDLIVKVDDDDWYSRDYMQRLSDAYQSSPFDFSSQKFCNMVFINNKMVYDETKVMSWDKVGATFAFSRKFFDHLVRNRERCLKDPFEDKIWLSLLDTRKFVIHNRPNKKDFMYVRHGNNTVKQEALPTKELIK